MTQAKHTTITIQSMRQKGEPIVMVTAYDASQASHAQDAGVDVILVGDSVGMVMLGYDTTIPVTVDDMVHHAKAVRRGAGNTMVLVDMPFASYRQTVADTVRHAARIMQEAQADGVKLEGGTAIASHVRALAEAGIPVCGHLGLTPQSVLQLGGYRVQGRDERTAERMLEDARALADAGAFLIVLECVPNALGKLITESVPVPTIGIGGGPDCSGQVLVYHDLLGLNGTHQAKFVKRYASLRAQIVDSIRTYRSEVKERSFPTSAYGYDVATAAVEALAARVRGSDSE